MLRALLPSTTLALILAGGGHAAVGDAFPAFAVLCAAWDAATNKQIKPWSEDRELPELNDIYNMNMSIASEEWQTIFDGQAEQQTWSQFAQANAGKYKGIDWKQNWDRWRKQRQQTKDAGGAWQTKNHRPEWAATPRDVRPVILAIAEEATELSRKLEPPRTADGKDLIAEINSKLASARCSGELKAAAGNIGCTGPEGTPDKTTTCTTAKAGGSIGHDMLCLCSVAEATDKCSSTGVGDAVPNSGEKLRSNGFQHIVARCPKGPESGTLPQAIDLALAMLATALGTQQPGSNNMILGKSGGGTCTATNSACVDYHEKFSKQQAGITGIPWVALLQQARALYGTYVDAKLAAQTARQQIVMLAGQAKREYRRPAGSLKDPAGVIQEQATNRRRHGADDTNQCTSNNATADECPETRCEYDSEKNECRPKKGTETTATGPGERTTPADGKANNTVSDSLLIKTSPLWLAFLLF
uniref:Variant surface glycoprotein ILTAT 1.21 n=1 Tax=Trypanosoma brucei brucei TaxID=5702 RepID=VSI1_TRYBB|nr:RecName: Full=Variant surface glycoprotein ILTAT 1.21; Short=VSG; Flags: Precursor [Trypanosoma brucei brucei]CAA40085.1 variant surface glycoprotein ILTat 1.21 [Trypanosoma brucei]